MWCKSWIGCPTPPDVVCQIDTGKLHIHISTHQGSIFVVLTIEVIYPNLQ